jgi:hypothetical protein
MSINWPLIPGTLFPAGPPGTAGSQGPIGLVGPQGVAGPVGPQGPLPWTVPPSNWAPSTSYTTGPPASSVLYSNTFYVCTLSHISTSTFNAANWSAIVSNVGPPGAAGPSPFALPPTTWASSTLYTASAPASVVMYSGTEYVCIVSHTSTASFDASKWVATSVGPPGSAGPIGPAPWTSPTNWQPSTVYTATAPASCVIHGGTTYVCTTAHTSTATFDVTKWIALVTGVTGTVQTITSGNVTVTVTDTLILLNKAAPAPTAVALPLVSTYAQAQLLIADWNGNAGDVTLTVAGSDKIQNQTTWIIGSTPTSPCNAAIVPTPLGWIVNP